MRNSNLLSIILGCYLLLMGLSWGMQTIFPVVDKPNLYQSEKTIEVKDGEILYKYLHMEKETDTPLVILFPDHFYRPDFLLPLAESLHEQYNVIILKYPVKNSDGKLLSHSAESRSNYTSAFLDSLGADTLHIIGHGYGGLVSVDMLSKNHDFSIESSIFLSSFGVEELHFLGNQTINRSLYSLLYPVVFSFKYLTPHMGWFHQQNLDYEFVRAQRSLNQNQFRSQLNSINHPVLLLHPMQDGYVPIAISEETHRLVPHSYFVAVKGDHEIINREPEILTEQLNWFFDLAENGELLTRNQADEERIAKSIRPFDAEEIDSKSMWAILIIILLLALVSLVSEDLACIGGGLLVASGLINFWFAVAGGCLGIITSDVSTYLLGRWIGKPILEKIPFKWLIKPEDIEKAENMFEMRGVEIIFVSRFLPGVRFPTYLAAGILRINFIFFVGYFLLAVAIWAPLLVGISVLIGQPMIEYLQIYQEYALFIIIGILVLIYGIIKVIIPLTTITGRRRLFTKLNRFMERLRE